MSVIKDSEIYTRHTIEANERANPACQCLACERHRAFVRTENAAYDARVGQSPKDATATATPYGTIYRSGDREWFAGSREQLETAKAWEARQ